MTWLGGSAEVVFAMHELSIAYNLVELADEAARAAGATRVIGVKVRLGAMAGVVEDALRFCFPLAADGTCVAGAELVVEHIPAQMFCDQCAAQYTLSAPFVFQCPGCGKPTRSLISGRELQLESIEIEDEGATPQAPQVVVT